MRSVRRLKAYQKVALVAATAVVGGFVVAAVTFASVNNARNHLRDVERHSGPQTALLERLTAEVTADRLAHSGARPPRRPRPPGPSSCRRPST